MNPEVVEVKRIVRRVRGGSQSRLVEAVDGFFYIAKFSGNPQGTRTLINEWLGTWLFQQGGVSAPSLRLLRISKQLAQSSQDFCFKVGRQEVPIKAGLHLGSQCPVNPLRQAIFDFLPRKLVTDIINVNDFASALFLDQVLGQTDSRQAVFTRGRSNGNKARFQAYFIDHGMLFGGTDWELRELPLQVAYYDRSVYSAIDIKKNCEELLSAAKQISRIDVLALVEPLPGDWFASGDSKALLRLQGQIRAIHSNLEYLIERHQRMLQSYIAPKPERPRETVADLGTSIAKSGPMTQNDRSLVRTDKSWRPGTSHERLFPMETNRSPPAPPY